MARVADPPSAQAGGQSGAQAGAICMDRYEAPNQKGAQPLFAQGANEGQAWCALQGKRLCTHREWERACSGPSGRAYPYGNRYKRGACVDDKSWRAPDWGLIQKVNTRAGCDHVTALYQAEASGSRASCVSEEGIFDLAGNVAEWVVRDPAPASMGGASGYAHGLMGCYWSGCYNMHRAAGTKPGCRGTMNAGHPGDAAKFRTYEAGFRCCLKLTPLSVPH
jgi:formylglycine-generating enzyme required for sulfatase activity